MSSHCHTMITRQPRFLNSFCLSLSRSMFWLNFSFQNSTLVDGVVEYLQFVCLCQKQPCTKITVRCFGNTISGVPGSSFTWILNLYPNRCSRERIFFSGLVFFPRTLPIISDRFFLETVSVIWKIGVFEVRKTFDDRLVDIIHPINRIRYPGLFFARG